jgi:hypothetical protein
LLIVDWFADCRLINDCRLVDCTADRLTGEQIVDAGAHFQSAINTQKSAIVCRERPAKRRIVVNELQGPSISNQHSKISNSLLRTPCEATHRRQRAAGSFNQQSTLKNQQ